MSDSVDEYVIQTTNNIPDNQWIHVAVVVDRDDSAATTIYVNGENKKSFTSGTLVNVGDLTTGDAFRIGIESDGSEHPFGGIIDDVRVYNYARTYDQINKDKFGGIVSGTVNNYQIVSSTDDVYEDYAVGGYNDDSETLIAGKQNGGTWLGLRFQNVNISSSSYISSAKIKVKSSSTQNLISQYNIYGHNTISPPTFSSSAKPTDRTGNLTSATVSHTENSEWDFGDWYYITPDISSIINNLKNLPGWNSSDKSIVILIQGTGTNSAKKEFFSHNFGPVDAPVLELITE